MWTKQKLQNIPKYSLKNCIIHCQYTRKHKASSTVAAESGSKGRPIFPSLFMTWNSQKIIIVAIVTVIIIAKHTVVNTYCGQRWPAGIEKHTSRPRICASQALCLLEEWLGNFFCKGPESKYWAGQEVRSGFSVRCYGKIRTNFLVNLIFYLHFA